MFGARGKRVDDPDDPPLFGRARAPPLPPPPSAQHLGGNASEEASEAPRTRPQLPVVVVPTSHASAEASGKPYPTCDARPYMDLLWALLQPLEACRGQSLSPDREVNDDGQVTFEWKSVVERDRSAGGVKSLPGSTSELCRAPAA
mmetsp:Transcript_21295/g.40073  ORF Transcript_21295/g.40073 Transcript_21295/m.40073 type:complete len:145 (+) Transcript_21295:61-495(+)